MWCTEINLGCRRKFNWFAARHLFALKDWRDHLSANVSIGNPIIQQHRPSAFRLLDDEITWINSKATNLPDDIA